MVLDEIVKDKRRRLIEQKKEIDVATMKRMALESVRKSISFYHALGKDGLSIIGEFKKASPSMGVLDSKINRMERIHQYNQSVDAISCLTEEDHFNGSSQYLKEIRETTKLPILRKDFIIDEYQIYEAKVIGADAILLIAAILEDQQMAEYYKLAYELGLDVLLEVHDPEEMIRALKVGAKIIGVNNRNLKDFSIRLETTKELSMLLEEMNKDKRPIFVSESGIMEREHIEFLKNCRVDALLIGRALMEAENPEGLAKEWKEVFNEV